MVLEGFSSCNLVNLSLADLTNSVTCTCLQCCELLTQQWEVKSLGQNTVTGLFTHPNTTTPKLWARTNHYKDLAIWSLFFSSTHTTKLPTSLTLHKWVQHKQGTTHYWGQLSFPIISVNPKFSGPDFSTDFCKNTCICTQTQNSPSQNNIHLYLPCKMETAMSGTKAVKNQAAPASCFKNQEMNSLSIDQISVPFLEHQNHQQLDIICPPELCWGLNWSCWL